MALNKVIVLSLLLGLAASLEETCHVDGTCRNGVEDVDAAEENSVSLLQTQMKTTAISVEETIAVYTRSEEKLLEDASASLEKEGPAMAADMVKQCDAKVKRFATLNNQSSFSDGNDPEFPPTMQSIGDAGSTCGDTAAGISEGCEKYNHWKTMQDVAKSKGLTFSVIGTSGINWNDVQQGELGNCYFLAALAAIANARPEILDNMFVDKHLWSENIFKTRWFFGGQESIVTVDNMIPAGDYGTFFTHQSLTGEFWTVILAKTWAKIYGNFKAVEAGNSDVVIRAITGSASEYLLMPQQTADKLWNILLKGTQQKFPTGAGTGSVGNPTAYGLAVGHAYAVMGARVDETYGKVVEMYNPWGSDNYNGSVPNTEAINGPNKGKFTMTFAEFMDAYDEVSINFVMPDYKVASMEVPTGKLTALDVTVSSPGKFWVSMVWPTLRLVAPCPFLNPSGFLESVPGAGGNASKQLPRMPDTETLSAEFANPNGGTYNVLAIETFRTSGSWIKAMRVQVYAPVKADIAASTDSTEDMALKMFGPANGGKPCKGVTVPDAGFMKVNASTTVGGVPTYWTGDAKMFMYYSAEEQKWKSVGASKLAEVQAGEMWSSASFDKSDMKCGCDDAAQGIVGWGDPIPCNETTAANHRYSNLQCHGQSDSGSVQTFCPRTCSVCPDK